MEELIRYRKNLLDSLVEVVDELRAAAAVLPPQAWHIPTAADQPTPHWTLAHLRNVEAQIIAVRIRRILDEEEPDLPLFDDEAWMADHYDPAEPVQAILEAYASLRQQELTWLRDFPPVAWNRTARHPWWGVRSLQWWVEQCLQTARQHLQELQKYFGV